MEIRLIDLIKQKIDEQKGEPFSARELIQSMEGGPPFNMETARIVITRDLVRQGVLKCVGQRGRAYVFQKTATMTENQSTEDLQQRVLKAIKAATGPFTIDEICQALTDQDGRKQPRTPVAVITGHFLAAGLIQRVGVSNRRKNVFAYIGDKGAAPARKDVSVRENAPEKRPDLPTTEIVRNIIRGFNGREFTTHDVKQQLTGQGIQIKANVFSVMISRELCKLQRFIERVGKKGALTIYRQRPENPPLEGEQSQAAENPPPKQKRPQARETATGTGVRAVDESDDRVLLFNPGTLTSAFYSVAAGLERFSLEYVSTEIKKTGAWEKTRIKPSIYSLISHMKSRGLMSATSGRPVVYMMAPEFYLYNVRHLIGMTATAPHLEQRIMQKFAKHCGPDPISAPAAAEKRKSPETIKPPAEKAAGTVIALNREKREQLEKEIEEIKNKLSDRNIDVINLKTRNQDLESQVQKLNREIGRLTAKVDEKDRVNSALQHRLNATRNELDRAKRRSGNSFSFGEVARIK